VIEWFDGLKLGMRFTSGETTVRREDVKRDVDGRDEARP
jgi:hypothetical protein